MTDTVESVQDNPVEIIVFGMQLGRHRMKEEGKLQHKSIEKKYKRVGRGFLSEDTDHMVFFGLLEIDFCKERSFLQCLEINFCKA